MRAVIFVTLSLLATALAEVVEIHDCENVSNDTCKVEEVRITPCRKTSGCVLKRGKEYGISFDFVPKFSTDKLMTTVFKADVVDIPFAALNDADGCQYTTCPSEEGKSQQLNYGLRLSKKLPRGHFMIKWKVWNELNTAQSCCFKTALEIK